MAADSARKKKKDSPANVEENGLDMGEEPNFSDPEDYVDNASDKELMPDLLSQRPKETDGIDSVIVVDNVPKVGPERVEKLKNVIRKIYSKFGKIVNEFYPEEGDSTKGYIFLEYSNPASAKEAVSVTNGHKLDKQHTFKVNLFSDFDKYYSVEKNWTPPEPIPYKDHGNLQAWMLNEDCCDQYSIINEGGERTSIYINNTSEPEPILIEERARWTETYVRWSPQGTYLATFHSKGIALWGGEKFGQIMKFSHPGVQLIDFSPCEKYLVSFSPIVDHSEDPQSIVMFDLRTGRKKRGFHCENASMWPIFKWSHDGKYVARMGQDVLSVYETPSFGLLDKRSSKIPGIKDFSWSPSDNYIVYWVPESSNVPARVAIMSIPDRVEIATKNLFHVVDCKIHWQKSGDFLCVKVDRYSKKKETPDQGIKYSGIYHHFELFRMREKQIPVDQVECKETVMAFAWEPNGNKFGFIHGESTRISISFYVMRPAGKVELVKCLERRPANSMFWSPQGTFVVLAGLRGMNGTLEFLDTSDMTIMNSTEHFMASTVEWDPTGRYIATGVSFWDHKMDNAYWIWSFQGRLMQKNPSDRFCQFLWRPRPPSPLTNEMVKEIKKNIKKYSVKFEMKDRMMQSKVSKEALEKRQKVMSEYRAYRKDMAEVFAKEKPLRLELRRNVDTDELDYHVENFEEETFELLVSTTEVVIEE